MHSALYMGNKPNRNDSEAASYQYDFIYWVFATDPLDDDVLKCENGYPCDQVRYTFDRAAIALGMV
jgi:hypothetical protein